MLSGVASALRSCAAQNRARLRGGISKYRIVRQPKRRSAAKPQVLGRSSAPGSTSAHRGTECARPQVRKRREETSRGKSNPDGAHLPFELSLCRQRLLRTQPSWSRQDAANLSKYSVSVESRQQSKRARVS